MSNSEKLSHSIVSDFIEERCINVSQFCQTKLDFTVSQYQQFNRWLKQHEDQKNWFDNKDIELHKKLRRLMRQFGYTPADEKSRKKKSKIAA